MPDQIMLPAGPGIWVDLSPESGSPCYRFWVGFPPTTGNHQHGHNGKSVFLRFEVRRYRDQIASLAWSVMAKPLSGPVRAIYLIFMPNNRKRDRGNVLKVLEDALNGYFFEDDSNVLLMESETFTPIKKRGKIVGWKRVSFAKPDRSMPPLAPMPEMAGVR